ncbi:hypothetical protein Tco_0651948 [Tanacetum coccineum]|uniref:Uncharacterized protein n=1 Tax=Tanacetum coccineum TaxID=301880 RepID=A0ABQ4WW72_9ASTR
MSSSWLIAPMFDETDVGAIASGLSKLHVRAKPTEMSPYCFKAESFDTLKELSHGMSMTHGEVASGESNFLDIDLLAGHPKAEKSTAIPLRETLKELQDESKGRHVADSIADRLTRPNRLQVQDRLQYHSYLGTNSLCYTLSILINGKDLLFHVLKVIFGMLRERDVVPPGYSYECSCRSSDCATR